MITLYNIYGARTIPESALTAIHLQEALWVDLLSPTRGEETSVEHLLDIDIPTREEMQEIETTSRLYQEGDGLYMTAAVVAHADSGSPVSAVVTFILLPDKLITVRYEEPSFIRLAATQFAGKTMQYNSSDKIMLLLFGTLIDRLADLLERANETLDTLSATVFSAVDDEAQKPAVDFRQVLIRIGRNGDLVARVRDSLTSLNRIYSFLGEGERLPHHSGHREELAAIKTDLASLSEHASFLTSKISFLLDATLGMINIEQNNIIKAMSIAATVFLPPTLIASAYGMNFDVMPELHWSWGYPVVVVMMLVSGVLPYWYFKRKGWV